MKKKLSEIFVQVFIILILFPMLYAGADTLPMWSHETASNLTPDPAILFGKLNNGFRYILMKNETPKNRVSIHLHVMAGSLNELDGEEGYAHFLEHLLFCGSTHFKPGELVKYLQSIGMEFGPDVNGHTSFHETVYDIFLPDGTLKSLEDGLIVMEDYAQGGLLLKEEIERERNVVLAEKRSRDSVSYRTFVETLKFEMPESKIARRFPIGEEDALNKADQKRMKYFYDTWYRPEKMTLIMVGDFDIETAQSLIKGRFSGMTARAPSAVDPDIGKISHTGIKAFYHNEKEAGNTSVIIEVLTREAPEQDSPIFRKRVLLEDMANKIVRNRLDALLRKPDAPFTSVNAGSGYYLKEVRYAVIDAECKPENWKKTLSTLEHTLRQALIYQFTSSEVERVKKEFLSELDEAVKKASTRESTHLAREIMSSINRNRVFQSPEQKKAILAPFIVEASSKDLHNAFLNIWKLDHRLIIVTGNANIESGELEIKAEYDRCWENPVSEPKEDEVVIFPYLPEPKSVARPASESLVSDLEIRRIEFTNGIYLNLKKTDFEANSVVMNVAFGPGRFGEPFEKPGLSMLTEALINESGLGALDADALNRALAGKTAELSFNISDEAFFFKGKAVSEDLELLFQLVHAYLVDPGYREDAFSLVMERFRQHYLSLSRMVEGAMMLTGERFLAGGDSRFGFPAQEIFEQMTLEDVRTWIDPFLKNEPLEISIVGDFKVSDAVILCGKYLGTLPKRNSISPQKGELRGEFPAGKRCELDLDTKIDKGMIVVSYLTDDMWDIKKNRRVALMADVFSERLNERIREKLGATYTPYAYNKPSRVYKGYGTLRAFVYIDPKDADMVINEIFAIAEDMSKNSIRADEFKRSIEPKLTSIKDLRRQNRYWLETVLTGSRQHPEQLDWSRTILSDYASITHVETSEIAKAYLNNAKAAVIIAKPATN